jgi:multidrug efflux pump subunit AcrB
VGISGRIAAYFQDSQLTPLLALLALLLGIFAVAVTPREEEPQIDVTMANVLVPFPGASATDVEQLVAGPAEQVLAQMTGVEHVYSVSQPGLAVLTVQFAVGERRTDALVRLYDTVDSNRDWLSPELGVGEPIIKPKGIDDVPIVAFTLWSDDGSTAFDLERIAHAIEIELKRVPGTREVRTLGGPGRAVRVLLDADRLAAHGIAPLAVARALAAANAALPSGHIVRDNREIRIETGNHFANAADVRGIVVGVTGGRPVFLADVADVEDGAPPPRQFVRMGTRTGERPAVTLQVTKQPGANAVDVADGLLARVAALRGSLIPDAVQVTVTRNYGVTADEKARQLITKLAFATLSVVALVFFALGRREAAIVGIAVLLTLATTLFASWAWGFTLNRVSLFALIFSIGILVDDAIVVVENIHRRMALAPAAGGAPASLADRPLADRPLADRPLAGVIPAAVDEVGGPTILATLTVIAALLPMAFVSGLMGPYMSPIPINASLGMLISLAIAFTVTPWLALRLLAMPAGTHAGGTHAASTHAGGEGLVGRALRALLSPLVASRRRRLLLVAGVTGAIAASLALAFVQLVVLKMLPLDNKSEFQVVVDLPAGTPVEITGAVLGEMGAELAKVPEVTDYQAYAGTAAPINFNGLVRQYYLRSAPEQGDVQVNLVPKATRTRDSHDIAQAVRPALEAIAARWGAQVKVVEVPPGPPVLSPVVAEVYGPDAAGREQVAAHVRDVLAGTPGVIAVDDSIEEPAPRIVLRVDQAKAALAGVAVRDVAATLRLALDGEPVTPLHDGQSKYEVPVRVELPAEQAGSLDAALKLGVRGAVTGALVPVSELVSPARDDRDRPIHHKDLLPVTYVVADQAGRIDSPLYGMFAARDRLAGMPLDAGGTLGEYFVRQPPDPWREYAIKWDGEWQITYETFRDMGLAYAVGLVLIYLLVVAHFRSYVTPLVIMAPIPLTVIGVMPGHALLGANFTATSMIGMIALAGIIVRNSILLVDFVDQRLAEGVAAAEAVQQAAAARARPIVLTGLAAMLGAVFILDDPIFNGLAISLLFGILVSTLLTLVVIPVLYLSVTRRRKAPHGA